MTFADEMEQMMAGVNAGTVEDDEYYSMFVNSADHILRLVRAVENMGIRLTDDGGLVLSTGTDEYIAVAVALRKLNREKP